MTRASIFRALVLVGLTCATSAGVLAQSNKYARDPKQPIDEEYTKKIREYTTETFFKSPLVDYLPASKTVPTPKAVLGDVAGAPGKLPYTAEVYKYMRMLEKASPASEGLLDRHDRRRPRDDCRRGHLGSHHVEARREPRASRETGGPSHDQHGRCRSRPAGRTSRCRSTTSPARFTRPRPARRPL